MTPPSPCFALAIGNSRLHWLWEELSQPPLVWHTPHLSREAIAHWLHHRCQSSALPDGALMVDGDRPLLRLQQPLWDGPPPLLHVASVVPTQTRLWQDLYTPVLCLSLADVPLDGLYPSLGLDRAIALWGLMAYQRSPALVIDAGTALTFTGADAQRRLVGGAIVPGLSLQLRSLSQQTAALPWLDAKALHQPERWASSTEAAIYSGVLHTLLAGLKDFVQAWQQDYPTSAIALTGGDAPLLYRHLQQSIPTLAQTLDLMPSLLMMGLRSLTCESMKKRN